MTPDEDWCEQGKGKIIPADTVRDDTIKRCAQTARDTLVRLDYPVPAEMVFEAIMALKDQAPHSFEDNPLDWRRP